MDLAVLAAISTRAPLAIQAFDDRAQFDLAETCASYGLECAAIDPPDLRAGRDFEDVDVLIVRNLHLADRSVQAQAIDLIRGRGAKDPLFLFVVLVEGREEGTGLTQHLNDLILLLHTHIPDEEQATPPSTTKARLLHIQALAAKVSVSAEVLRYTHDIVTFLRLHRAVGGGVSAVASRQLGQLSRVLAVLNGLSFVTPTIVAMAARKVFTHRIQIVPVHKERSLQWGSDLLAVAQALDGVTVDDVVEEILRTVEPPL